MARQYPYIPTVATIVLLVVIATLAAMYAPAGARLAIHWNDAGMPDGFATVRMALILPLALCVGLTLPLAFLYSRLTPMPLLVGGLLASVIVYEAMIAAPVFGLAFPYALSPLMAVWGVVYILMGNRLPKSRPIWRRPPTRFDTDHLIASRRFSARFWIGGGVVILLAALLPLDGATRGIVNKVALGIVIVPPLIYSPLWRQPSSRGSSGSD